jgi:hypothetical protein
VIVGKFAHTAYGNVAPVAAVLLAAAFLLAGCMNTPNQPDQQHAPAPQEGLIFSALSAAAEPAKHWINRPVLPNKQLTNYALIDGASVGATKTVLRATADQSASLLLRKLPKPQQAQHIRWSWKVEQLNTLAKTADPKLEDSPVRIVLAFAAPSPKALANLPFKDQLFLQSAKLMHREEPPYATLMYVWSNDLPADTVINSAHTGRIRMLVAESGAARAGQWLEYNRNIAADYKRAFGAEPGKLIGVAILSDTDNTRLKTTAYYSDIELYKPANAE